MSGSATHVAHPQVPLRDPNEVMRLERMGSNFPTRLSFMRSAIRALAAEGTTVERPVWEIDDEGFGHAVYSLTLGGHTYSLIAFSNALDPANRTDRVIANQWDTAYVLFDGLPTRNDIDRIGHNAPRQEAGRFTPDELILSRANKSVRLFDHVVERLAAGSQPDETMLTSVGYLMRTTAVYGNGKFGIADRTNFVTRDEAAHPFRLELVTVWLIRGFTIDLVEHIAHRRSPATAVPMARHLKRHLGIGNSTGLGMAPFLVNHPVLINNWVLVRETALARVRAIETPTDQARKAISSLMARARRHIDQWQVDDERQMRRIERLRLDLERLEAVLTPSFMEERWPWDRLVRASAQCSLECQELVVGLVIEPYGDLVDGLVHCMQATNTPRLNPAMSTTELASLIDDQWRWALTIDFADPEEIAQFWYVSEEKLEPRLGNRHEEDGAEREQPLDIARRVQHLAHALETARDDPARADDELVATFLMRNPEHRLATRRVQTLARAPYGEIRDNLIGSQCLPIDMLRSKLSFFGASKFDPRSDRWTRITLYQGAPLLDEINGDDVDDWWLPVYEPAASP